MHNKSAFNRLLVVRQIDGIAPTFAQKPSIKQEEDGKRLRFECRILADPRPDVSWFHDGNPVKNGGRHRVCCRLLAFKLIIYSQMAIIVLHSLHFYFGPLLDCCPLYYIVIALAQYYYYYKYH